MGKQPLREFFDALNREEAVIREWIAEDAFGLRMRLAINELDLELEGALRTGRETGADEERAYLMRLGVNRLVKLALDAQPAKLETVSRRNERVRHRGSLMREVSAMLIAARATGGFRG